MTVIVIRVPTRLWDEWEERFPHFGRAIYALRESVIELLAAGTLLRRGIEK